MTPAALAAVRRRLDLNRIVDPVTDVLNAIAACQCEGTDDITLDELRAPDKVDVCGKCGGILVAHNLYSAGLCPECWRATDLRPEER